MGHGASHQSEWSGLIAAVIQEMNEYVFAQGIYMAHNRLQNIVSKLKGIPVEK
jgi:hypothetical protein